MYTASLFLIIFVKKLVVTQLQQSRRYANNLRANLLGTAEKTRPPNDVHRLRKVPKRVEGGTVLNAPWVVLALVANTAMRPFSFPFFLSLRPHSLGTALFSLRWFVGQSLSGLSLAAQAARMSRTAAA